MLKLFLAPKKWIDTLKRIRKHKCKHNHKEGKNKMKTDVIAILQTTKEQQLSKVAEIFDGMIAQVNALPEDAEVTELQKQVADLNNQVAAIQAAFDADEAELTSEKAKEAKLQARLDAIKAALEA